MYWVVGASKKVGTRPRRCEVRRTRSRAVVLVNWIGGSTSSNIEDPKDWLFRATITKSDHKLM